MIFLLLALAGLSAAQDCSACPSCVQANNPTFDKQCAVDIVFVLDETGSIRNSQNGPEEVRSGSRSFFSALSQIKGIGGVANIAIVEFGRRGVIARWRRQDNGNPGTLDHDDTCMYPATPENVRDLDYYIKGDIRGAEGYRPGTADSCGYGTTGWAGALETVYTTPWRVCDENGNRRKNPDIVIWFTDGRPNCYYGTCDNNCNAGSALLSGGLEPSITSLPNGWGRTYGVSCYYADLIKQRGNADSNTSPVKIFLVGVGEVTSDASRVQLVTGRSSWAGASDLDAFSTADYILDAEFGNLGNVLYSVVQGLCKCLQDQSPCVGTGGDFCKSSFSSKVRIRSPATGSTFPVNSNTWAYLYYAFDANPATYAWEIVAAGNPGALIRTDIINPCTVVKTIGCPSVGGCFKVADQSFVPRFFRTSTDSTVAAPTTGFLPANCPGATVYQKSVADTARPESVEFVWFTSGTLCAARAKDGTLFEFYQNTAATTPGVNYAAVPQNLRSGTGPFDFNALSGCSAPKCQADIDLLFLVDEKIGNPDTPNDWRAIKSYVQEIVSTFEDSNNRIRMGMYLPASATRIPASGWATDLNAFFNSFNSHAFVNTDFSWQPSINTAVTSFWGAAAAPPAGAAPRKLFAIVGAPDKEKWAQVPPATASVSNWNNRKALMQIEAYAVGVLTGALQVDLLEAIADSAFDNPVISASFRHWDAFGSISTLIPNIPDISARLCPSGDLCNGNCAGICVCGQSDCRCPTCQQPSDLCILSSCDAGSANKACVLSDKRQLLDPVGCIDTDACTNDACNPATGTCSNVVGACSACSSCTPGPCETVATDASCNCIRSPVVCDSSDLCNPRVCNPAIGNGTCQVQPVVCNDQNSCTTDRCVVKDGAAVCEYTDATESLCINADPCLVASCEGSLADPNCTFTNLTALVESCGTCGGLNTTCLFAGGSINAGALAGGIIAAIVVAAVVAAVILFFVGRKGYQHYQSKSDLGAAMTTNNPSFSPRVGDAGHMPGV